MGRRLCSVVAVWIAFCFLLSWSVVAQTSDCTECDIDAEDILCAAASTLQSCYTNAQSGSTNTSRCTTQPINECQFAVWRYFCSACSDECFYKISCMQNFPTEIKWQDSAQTYWKSRACTIASDSSCPAILAANSVADLRASGTDGTVTNVTSSSSSGGGASAMSGTVIAIIAVCGVAVLAVMMRAANGMGCSKLFVARPKTRDDGDDSSSNNNNTKGSKVAARSQVQLQAHSKAAASTRIAVAQPQPPQTQSYPPISEAALLPPPSFVQTRPQPQQQMLASNYNNNPAYSASIASPIPSLQQSLDPVDELDRHAYRVDALVANTNRSASALSFGVLQKEAELRQLEALKNQHLRAYEHLLSDVEAREQEVRRMGSMGSMGSMAALPTTSAPPALGYSSNYASSTHSMAPHPAVSQPFIPHASYTTQFAQPQPMPQYHQSGVPPPLQPYNVYQP